MLVLLHGFAGTGRAWDPVVAELGATPYLAPDIHRLPPTFDGCVAALLDAAPERFTLAGYSMGGRVALLASLAAPTRVERLVLISTTAGLEGDQARQARRDADEQLARRTESGTIEAFADAWSSQPLFAGTAPAAAAAWREDLLRNDPETLAAALRGLGTGAMTPVWDRLHELTMPVDVVVGERDAKFLAIGERLAAALPRGELHVLEGVGHGLPREAPLELSRAILGPSAPR
jgi:2-succinyl-6-hydroxy-2,4-cyclohexadiene-1-carboxylate synthase